MKQPRRGKGVIQIGTNEYPVADFSVIELPEPDEECGCLCFLTSSPVTVEVVISGIVRPFPVDERWN